MIIRRVLYNIMANDYVSEDFKDRLRVAARSGRDKQTCLVSETHTLIYENLERSRNLFPFQAFECAALNPGVTNTLD